MALRVSVGRYYPVASPVHRLDPRTKVAAALLFMVSCFLADGAPTLALAAAAVATVAILARIPVGRLLGSLRPLAVFLVVSSVISLVLTRTGSPVLAAGPLVIYSDGVTAAIVYAVRFFLLLAAGDVLMLTTRPTELTDGIERLLRPLERLGVPVAQAMVTLSIALRFVPTLSREAEDVLSAQTARGADLEDRGALSYALVCIPLVVPLFASALRHAEALGRAMEARCYTGDAGRTHYRELRLSPVRDGAFIAAALAYLVALIALRILL